LSTNVGVNSRANRNHRVLKGGQHVAQCAQSMDKGVSDCAQMTVCEK